MGRERLELSTICVSGRYPNQARRPALGVGWMRGRGNKGYLTVVKDRSRADLRTAFSAKVLDRFLSKYLESMCHMVSRDEMQIKVNLSF